MLIPKIRIVFCLLIQAFNFSFTCAETKTEGERPVDLTDFIVVEKIRIPVLTEWGISFFEFDVKITGLKKKDVNALKAYKSRIRDLILSDSFDSVCALVYGQKNVTAQQINALQRRVWICILRWIGANRLPIQVVHVDILHAKYFTKRRMTPPVNKEE